MEALLGGQNEQLHADPLLSILELYCDPSVINCEIFSQREFIHLNLIFLAKLSQQSTDHCPAETVRSGQRAVSFLCHTKRHSVIQLKHVT